MNNNDAISKIMKDYERTIANCEYYANLPLKDVRVSLANEIGVARGLAYALESLGVCPHTEKFLKLIKMQQMLKYIEKIDAEEVKRFYGMEVH